MVNVLDKNCTEKTHFIFNFFYENRAVNEIMWENIAEPERPQMIIRRMRTACRIPKVPNTHSEYAILITIPR
jgi:hypothetical protein